MSEKTIDLATMEWVDVPTGEDYFDDMGDGEKRKLDIFEVLRNADMGNKDYYANLDEESKKGFAPIVAMRWFSSAPDSSAHQEYLLLMTNEILNLNFWALQNHPELQWKLMTLCGKGMKIPRKWINMPKRQRNSKVDQFMLQWFPGANDQELSILTQNLSREEFEQFVNSTGCTDEEFKETLKAFDAERGTKPEKATSKAGGKKRKA